METINSYLNNVFASLPQNGQMLKLKQEMLATMEEKYYELKQEGKSENEAVGIVISEFGNIDELMAELGIKAVPEEAYLPVVTDEEAISYLTVKKRSGLLTGIGVFMCLTGVALLILISTLSESGLLGEGLLGKAGGTLGVIALLLFIVPAVSIFIYSSTKLERYKYLEGEFIVPVPLKMGLQQELAAFSRTYTLSLITGVCLAILSPVAIFIASILSSGFSSYGVSIMLLIVAVAVFLFIYYGSIRESYNVLLQTGDFSKEKKEENRVIGAVASIVWPLATCIFLASGFIYDKWHINWVIFPITGILFGMFCGAYSILRGQKQ